MDAVIILSMQMYRGFRLVWTGETKGQSRLSRIKDHVVSVSGFVNYFPIVSCFRVGHIEYVYNWFLIVNVCE